MPKIENFKQLFDEQHEIMAWLTFVGAWSGIVLDRIEDWPGVALIGVALLTMLGSAFYKGVSIGPGGLNVE